MPGTHRLVHYLRGTPEGVDGAPDAVEVPRLYDSQRAARSDLSVIMTLSRMVHGDAIADGSSWYLQTALTACGPTLADEEIFHGYRLGDTVHPVAGGWDSLLEAYEWEPFVAELERRRAHRARLPWRRDLLSQFSLDTCRGTCDVDYAFFRFTPIRSELLVRPLHVYATEPLF